MSDNLQLILAAKNGEERVLFHRDPRRGVTSIEYIERVAGDDEGVSVRIDDHQLARLRAWLVTGIEPSNVDLVDPVPDPISEPIRLDPSPRDLRSEAADGVGGAQIDTEGAQRGRNA